MKGRFAKLLAAMAATLLVAASCGGKVFVDLDGASSVGGGGHGAGGSSGLGPGSSSTSSAASSSATSSSTTSGDPETHEVCRCLASTHFGPNANACNKCIRHVTGMDLYPPGPYPCASEEMACYNDPKCHAIWMQLSEDKYDLSKIGGDILPLDQDEAHLKLKAVVECACPLCTDTCTYTDAVPSCP